MGLLCKQIFQSEFCHIVPLKIFPFGGHWGAVRFQQSLVRYCHGGAFTPTQDLAGIGAWWGEYFTTMEVIMNPPGSDKHHVGNRDIKSACLGTGEMTIS